MVFHPSNATLAKRSDGSVQKWNEESVLRLVSATRSSTVTSIRTEARTVATPTDCAIKLLRNSDKHYVKNQKGHSSHLPWICAWTRWNISGLLESIRPRSVVRRGDLQWHGTHSSKSTGWTSIGRLAWVEWVHRRFVESSCVRWDGWKFDRRPHLQFSLAAKSE